MAEVVLVAVTALLACLWAADPSGNYEPWTVLAGVGVAIAEAGRRRLQSRLPRELLAPERPLAPQIVLPGRTIDVVAKGEGGAWDSIVQSLRDETGLDKPSREHLLPLLVSYDISRVRRVADYKQDLLFIDSSWLVHGYSHWSDDPDMARWLDALRRVSQYRIKRGHRTSRIFYWKPEEVRSPLQLQGMCITVIQHVHAGIDVTLVEPRHLPVLDAQRFSLRDALVSRNFGQLDIEQRFGVSEVEEVSSRIELVRLMVHEGDALHFEPSARVEDIYRRVGEKCVNLEGQVGPDSA